MRPLYKTASDNPSLMGNYVLEYTGNYMPYGLPSQEAISLCQSLYTNDVVKLNIQVDIAIYLTFPYTISKHSINLSVLHFLCYR